MRKLKKFIGALSAGAVAAGTFLLPEMAFAAGGIGEVASTIQGNFSNIKSAIVSGGFVVGALLAVTGVYLIYKDTKQPGQDHLKKGLVAVIVGALLLALPTVVDTSTQTIFNANGSNSLSTDFGR